MSKRKPVFITAIMLAAMLLAGCGAAATATQETHAPIEMPVATQAPAMAFPAPLDTLKGGVGGGPSGPVSEAPAPTAAAIYQTSPDTVNNTSAFSDHMIVKNGNVRLLVKNPDVALDGITQIVSDVQGYIVSSRVWFQDYYGTSYKYATLTLGVPVDQFENTLLRLRNLSMKVLDENDSGEDVTDQYVDLQSQLTNLEATRDRIKGFLDQAKNVDEALQINQQLSDVEAQIEQIKGKMNYLSNRSAFSTITVSIEPDLPKIVETPTPTPTPIPVQPLSPWDPGKTTQQASRTLISAYRVIIDMLIWIFLVFIPIVAPPVLVIWLIVWFVRRKTGKTAVKGQG